MKIFLISLALVMLTASCSHQAKEAVYNMMHERERQDCLKQGREDCPREESYQQYEKQRDEVFTP